jgi:hypothetical protein
MFPDSYQTRRTHLIPSSKVQGVSGRLQRIGERVSSVELFLRVRKNRADIRQSKEIRRRYSLYILKFCIQAGESKLKALQSIVHLLDSKVKRFKKLKGGPPELTRQPKNETRKVITNRVSDHETRLECIPPTSGQIYLLASKKRMKAAKRTVQMRMYQQIMGIMYT